MALVVNGTTVTKVLVNGTEIDTLQIRQGTSGSYVTVFTKKTTKQKTTELLFSGKTGTFGVTGPNGNLVYPTDTLSQTVTDSEGTVTRIISATKIPPLNSNIGFFSGPTIDGNGIKCVLYSNSKNRKATASVTVVYEVEV